MSFVGDQVPSIFTALSSLIDVPINRYSAETIGQMRGLLERSRQELRTKPRAADSLFASNVAMYSINASLGEVADPEERESLMKIPTTVYLTDAQIDRLLQAAGRLIRNVPDFQRLMQDLATGK
jgi:NTE family protein